MIGIFLLREKTEDSDFDGWDGPGWYFTDEEYCFHGPFSIEEEAKEIFLSYMKEVVR